MFSKKQFRIWNFESFIFWSKFRFLGDCFRTFQPVLFFNFPSSANQGSRHFYSAPYHKKASCGPIIWFTFSLKKKLKWKAAETGHCNLFQRKSFLTFRDDSCWCSSWEFNLFQYFDVSVLMPFHCSLTYELKLETAGVGHCNLFLWICFEYSWITNSHVFCGN